MTQNVSKFPETFRELSRKFETLSNVRKKIRTFCVKLSGISEKVHGISKNVRETPKKFGNFH